MGGILIQATHVLPDLLITLLARDWLARLPLLFRDASQMAIAVLVKTTVCDENGLNDSALLDVFSQKM